MKPSFDTLSSYQQQFWVNKVQDLIDRYGLSLDGEPILSAARRMYENTPS